jgi:chromosome segregation protein
MADVRRRAFVGERSALDALGTLLAGLHARLEDCTGSLRAEESVRVAMRSERVERLGALRRERAGIEQQLAELSERRQRCEIEQAESRVRAEAAVEALRRELDLTPEELLAAPLPEIAEGIDPTQRRGVVERELRELGPVNLLAESELAELSERNGFLEGQLEDIKRARRELNQVIHAIDTEIVSVFTAAFADVAVHFERLIETLFPGGSGSISLTAPDDLLESGVEIEARPAGRNVRRLSLLSGGERSLVALAFLFAVFRSRPSPFYLMDEVEAALDDANLQRFLALLEDFRGEAQLVVVSHQKRTMEVADALYGVSMQPGGASRVLSERLRNNAAAANRSAMASPSTS